MTINESLPIGSIIIWAGNLNDLPSNWRLCNGQQLKKSTYDKLYESLGNNWIKDEGLHTDFFNIPDLRGVFLRGVNDERADLFKDPDTDSRVRLHTGTTISMDLPGSYQKDTVGKHDHFIGQNLECNWDQHGPDNAGPVTNNRSAPIQSRTGNDGDNETRPVNVYVYYIIKVKNNTH